MKMRKKIIGIAAFAFAAALSLGTIAFQTNATEVVADAEPAKFEMQGGAQVRTADPAGIRFVTDANAAYKAQLAESYPTDTYTYVWGTELTFTADGSEQTIDAETKKWLDDESGWYTALVDIPATDYLTEITAQSYVKIYSGSELVYTDTVENAQTRSIAYSASWALNDGYNQDILYTYTQAIPDTSLTLDQEGVTNVDLGEEIQLTATAAPAQYGVAWRSSDENVATVDKNGKVTTVGYGLATITATLGNSSDSYQVKVPSPESKLVTAFNKDSNWAQVSSQTLTDGNVVGDKTLYGISSIESYNSKTMYITLSSAYMDVLFGDDDVTAITFDLILSDGTKTIKHNNNKNGFTEMATTVEYDETLGGYVYDITITRDIYETYGNDTGMVIVYTAGGPASTFFYVDNLEKVGPSPESKLVTAFNKDSNWAQVSSKTLTDGNVVGNKTLYGISDIGSYNSKTMYITLSSAYMDVLFEDDDVTAITFDLILSDGTKTIKHNNDKNGFTEMATTVEYDETLSGYVYDITITRDIYETYGNDTGMVIVYTAGGSASTFFYVDNLAVVK